MVVCFLLVCSATQVRSHSSLRARGKRTHTRNLEKLSSLSLYEFFFGFLEILMLSLNPDRELFSRACWVRGWGGGIFFYRGDLSFKPCFCGYMTPRPSALRARCSSESAAVGRAAKISIIAGDEPILLININLPIYCSVLFLRNLVAAREWLGGVRYLRVMEILFFIPPPWFLRYGGCVWINITCCIGSLFLMHSILGGLYSYK